MENLLFKGISDDDLVKMYSCLGARTNRFSAGETVCGFYQDSDCFGIVKNGIVNLERVDYNGNRYIIDRLSANDVFGETLSYGHLTENEVLAVCESKCEIIFISKDRIIHPCSQVCQCHGEMLTNLVNMISVKAQRLSLRVELLTNKTIREKLMSFFYMQAKKNGSNTFELPFSYSDTASWIGTDRSAMMREISKMKKDGIIETSNRRVTLLE